MMMNENGTTDSNSDISGYIRHRVALLDAAQPNADGTTAANAALRRSLRLNSWLTSLRFIGSDRFAR